MRILTLVLIFILASSAWAEPQFKYDNLRTKTVQKGGAIHLVVLGDGYLKKDEGLFEQDATRALNRLWSVSPFKELRNCFSVHLVYVESLRGTGSGNAAGRSTLFAFGSEESSGNHVSIKGQAEVRKAAANAPKADVIILLTTLTGRAHGQGNLVVLTTNGHDAVAHEMGHSVGDLGDEYDSSQHLNDRRPIPSGRDLVPANLTTSEFIDPTDQKTIAKTAKWGHFLELPGAFPLVSAYQGGYYRSVDVWRPSYRCVMRSSQEGSYCPVCHEEMTRKIMTAAGQRFDDKAYHKRFPLTNWR